MRYLTKPSSLLFLGLFFLTVSCFEEDKLDISVNAVDEPVSDLDKYINTNFVDQYGISIRYKFVDNFVDPGQRVAPPKLELIRPMLDFVDEFWVGVFADAPGGEAFFRDYVPAELVFLGGPIFNGDGTLTLGTADAGARITFTDVNSFDLNDEVWLTRQLNIVYHEFSHTVHQQFKLPTAFEEITASGYSSAGSWFNVSEEEALQRGYVTPYATSSPNEDFAETVAFYMFDKDFFDTYITLETNCTTAACEDRNEGRKFILEKLNSIKDHYLKVTGVDLDDLRAAVQSRL